MTELLAAMAIIFVVSAALLLGAHVLRLASVPFLILAGLIVGPFIDEGATLELAQWGIAFIVFTFGVHVEFKQIKDIIRESEITALFQFAVVATIAFGIGILLGLDAVLAGYFAIAAGLSSSIVGTSLLEHEIRANLVYGRLADSIHFIQDILAVVIILVISAEVLTLDAIGERLVIGIGLLFLAFLISRYLFDYLLAASEGSQELLMISSIAILIGFLGIAEWFGISIVVGAFAAGLAIKRDFTRNLGMINGVQSIRDFFAAIFFVTVGALVTVPSPTVAFAAIILVLLTAVVKPLVTIGVLVGAGYDTRSATFTSLNLDQVSEFALIIAIEAIILGFLTRTVFEAIVLAAAITMVTSSFTRRHQERIYAGLTRLGLERAQGDTIDRRSRIRAPLEDHVIIVGYGRIGRRLVEHAGSVDVPLVVIENDPQRLSDLHSSEVSHVFGDATNPYTWEKANMSAAKLIVSTPNAVDISHHLISLKPGADLILRAPDATTARLLLASGATYVLVTDILAGDQLVDLLRSLLDGDEDPAELREAHLQLLDELDGAGYTSMATIEPRFGY